MPEQAVRGAEQCFALARDVLKRHGLVDAEVRRFRAAQRRHAAAAAERLTEIVAQRADVSALRAHDAQGVLPVPKILCERKVEDRDLARLARDLTTLAGEVVELLAVYLDGRIHRRDLLDLAEKARQRRAHLVLRDGHGALFERFAGRILRVGHKAEL